MSKLPIIKFYKHGTFKTESKAKAAVAKCMKSDKTRTFFVKKRMCRSVEGGFKTRYTVVSVR